MEGEKHKSLFLTKNFEWKIYYFEFLQLQARFMNI